MKTIHLTIIMFLCVVFSVTLLQNANASSTSFYIDKPTYIRGDNILIYGSVSSYVPNTPVTIQILDNKNNSLLVSNTYPKPDDSFILRIPTNNTEWKSGGPYDVKVQYGSVYIGDSTFVFYADQLPPLKQADAGAWFSNITCNSGLVVIMKQEDGTVACVKPSNLQKLISLNWGYDPSEKLTVYGLKSVYKTGQEIDIKFRIHTFGSSCSYPQIIVRDLDQKIVWQSSPVTLSCPAGIPDGEYESEGYLGNNTNAPGYPMGLLIINQPGTYSMNISWLDGNVTKEFVVTPQTMSKLTSMDIKVFSSYTPSSLADHFLTGNLYSTAGPIQNGNITITVNGVAMGTTETYLNGCFQFNNWNDSKLADQINKSISLGDSSTELNFQAQYFGDSNHSPANASATSFLSLYAVPLAPAQYDTEVYPDQINVTQGDSTQFHITVKPFSKYWEVEHMKLNLQRTPCGLSYHISPVDNNDSVLVNNTAGFNAVLNTTSYTPSGKYWISIDQDLSGINEPNIGGNVGAFYLNVLKK